MADQPSRSAAISPPMLVALAPSGVALAALYWSGALAGRPALIAFLGIAVVTVILVQRYLVSLGRFARFVGELSGEREPVMPRLSFAPATEELATAAATLATGWRRQRASIDNLAASAQAIVDGLPDPLIAVDRQRRIVRTNRAAVALLGTMVPTATSRPRCAIPNCSPRSTRCWRRPTAISPGPIRSRSTLVLSGAPELDVMAHARRLPRAAADGSLALIVLHDTTALRRAERMRADFVANASHELKTPIAGIMGFIETLRGPARDDAAARERFLGIMAEQAERMRRLVDDLLMLSRIEQHEHARPDAAVDVGRVLEGVRDLLQLKASSRKVAIELAVEPALPPAVGDYDELTIVFQNLIDNAIKYARPATTVRVGRRAALGADRLAVAVSDEGDGIPGRASAAPHRALLPGRQCPLAPARRHRPRPRHRQARGQPPSRPARHPEQPGKGSVFTVTLPRRLTGRLPDRRPDLIVGRTVVHTSSELRTPPPRTGRLHPVCCNRNVT